MATVLIPSVDTPTTPDDQDPDNVTPPNAKIDAVFLAQTHVLSPDDSLFKLVGNRDALLKVQIIDPDAGSAPEVSVELNLSEVETETLTLQGPPILPISFDRTLAVVQHQFSDSFTVVIPKKWIKPGLQIRVIAGDDNISHNINVGAPNALTMDMFDIHFLVKEKETIQRVLSLN